MKKRIWVLAILVITGGGVLFYQFPQVLSLLEREKPEEDPLGFLNDLPEIQNPESGPPESRRKRPVRHPDEFASKPLPGGRELEQKPEQPLFSQVDNAEVQRVLLQIMAAQKLADGISLKVTDEEIEVTGVVESEARRQRILELLDKGRERRRISAQDLKVKP